MLVSTEGFYDSVRAKCVHELKNPGLVSWNAIINDYRINGHGESFSLCHEMWNCGEDPDSAS